MPNRILGVFANVLLPLLVGVVTVGLFLLFMPQDATRLFYTNLGVTLWLEMVFWAYMGLLRMGTKGVSVPFLAFLGVGAFLYMFCAGIWMLGYSLFLPSGFCIRKPTNCNKSTARNRQTSLWDVNVPSISNKATANTPYKPTVTEQCAK